MFYIALVGWMVFKMRYFVKSYLLSDYIVQLSRSKRKHKEGNVEIIRCLNVEINNVRVF